MPRRSLPELWKSEFTGYTADKFRQDLLASLTVAAVALPLALAFVERGTRRGRKRVSVYEDAGGRGLTCPPTLYPATLLKKRMYASIPR
jgi:hypothetical protein